MQHILEILGLRVLLLLGLLLRISPIAWRSRLI